jgi:acetolactate synthase-1/2/3 large subunit
MTTNNPYQLSINLSQLYDSFGVCFDDRVTGKLESFASCANIVHIDIDPAEIAKNKQPHISRCADVQLALQRINYLLKKREDRPDFYAWIDKLEEQKIKWPLTYQNFEEAIPPQHAIQLLYELTHGNGKHYGFCFIQPVINVDNSRILSETIKEAEGVY